MTEHLPRNYLRNRNFMMNESHDYVETMGSTIDLLSQRIVDKPRLAIYVSLFLISAIYAIYHTYGRASSSSNKTAKTKSPTDANKEVAKTSFKAPAREPGVWTPIDFTRPTATPFPDFNVHTTKPNPYRPFRWGPYHITMGLRNMKWDEWIELDNHYLRYHTDKAARILDRGPKCSFTDPSPQAQAGAHELLQELTTYLPERYPTLFLRTPLGIDNLLTGESFNTTSLPLAEDPMQTCARLIQDDLAIMFEREDGQYYLLAGSILLAGFWRLEDKLGMSLDEIHYSGEVPGYREKMQKGMNNFFKRLLPNGPMQRNNYFIQVDDNLPWSTSIGPEDSDNIGWNTASTSTTISAHHFRSERQTLRRLPRSGGIVFTIRTYFEPIESICEEWGVPGRLASAVRSWGDDVAVYKGREAYGEVLLGYLDRRHAEQVEAGFEEGKEGEGGGYPY